MTKGDCWAVPVERLREGSLYGLSDSVSLYFRRVGMARFDSHNQPHDEDAQHVEEKDTIKGLLRGSGNVLPGVARFRT